MKKPLAKHIAPKITQAVKNTVAVINHFTGHNNEIQLSIINISLTRFILTCSICAMNSCLASMANSRASLRFEKRNKKLVHNDSFTVTLLFFSCVLLFFCFLMTKIAY